MIGWSIHTTSKGRKVESLNEVMHNIDKERHIRFFTWKLKSGKSTGEGDDSTIILKLQGREFVGMSLS